MTAPAAEDIDCELHDDWLAGQDVNAWTSLSYLAVGAVIVAVVVRRKLPPAFAALGAVAALEGIGSLLYHGGTGDAVQLVHDMPLIGMLGFLAGWHVGRLGAGERRALSGALAGLVVGLVAGAIASVTATTSVVSGAAVLVIVAAELLARRRRLAALWTAPLLVLVALAFAAWLAGTSDSPLCDEQSWLQPHGAWHVLSALVVLAWMDRAAAIESPLHAPRLWRRTTDRSLGLLTKLLTHAFHRSVEVAGRERLPKDRPVLVVANHGNGFVDPIVVASVLGRLPRFLAKAALWKVSVARPFLALAGVLPVHRSADGDRPGDNRSVFEACHRELAMGATVAIFPEGTTGDRASLDRVKTGAARIALGALAGAPDLVVVPIGLAFESRTETRSRALVMVGAPIKPRASHPVVGGEPDHADARALTAEITAALERVSPEFATVEEREVLRAAGRVSLDAQPRRRGASFGEIEVLARRLAASPPAARVGVVDAFRRYATQLQLIGLTDRPLGAASISLGRVVLSVAALVVIGSLVATATLIHLPAVLLVLVATGAVRSTATKGTMRVLVGLAAGLLTWIVAGIVLADGFAAVVAGTLVAVEGAVALAVWTPLTRQVEALWGRLRVRDRIGLLRPVLAERAGVVAAVRAATPDFGFEQERASICRA